MPQGRSRSEAGGRTGCPGCRRAPATAPGQAGRLEVCPHCGKFFRTPSADAAQRRRDPSAAVNPLRAPPAPPLVPAVIAGLVAFWRLMRSADGPPRKRRRGRWDWLRPDAPVAFGSVGDGGGAAPCPLRRARSYLFGRRGRVPKR